MMMHLRLERHAGQSARVRRVLRQTACLALLLGAVGLGVTGCSGIYRDAQARYPSDACARLKLRIEDAQRAEKRAERATATLDERLAKGLTGEAVAPDFDRLESATLDFKRQLASAQDAAAACEEIPSFKSDLDQLALQAAQLQETLQQMRRSQSTGDAMH